VVLAGGVHEVVPADAVAVAVAAGRDDLEFGVGELRRAGDGQRAPVDRVVAVTLEVAVQLAGTADAGDQQHLVGVTAHLGHRLFQRLQDAEVATARAPRRLWL